MFRYSIVRYHTSWTSFDDPVPSFDALGSGTTLDSNTGTQTLSTTDASTQPSTEDDESGSDDSDSVVDFDEDSTPGDFDMDFGDELEGNLDFLSVGHAQSQSVSYPSIHFGNEDDPSRPGSERGSPGLSRAGFSKPPTKASTPVSTTPKQSRTLYIQVGRAPDLSDAT